MRIKICGITNEADACEAARLGADAIGLNFYRLSARHVSEDMAARILRALPPFVEAVGLFVNEPVESVMEHASRLGPLRTIQWHGDREVLPPATGIAFIRAFQIRDEDDLGRVTAYLEKCRAAGRLPAAILLDGHRASEFGGTGHKAPWGLLANFRSHMPIILAGGLTPENVAEAIRIVRPYAVDVASGVETVPGRKDSEKMRRFIENARNAFQSISITRVTP